jgi:peptidyl-prolyl cis-trans isomerase SurA
LEYAPGTYGYHIVYLESRVPQHPASIKEDYTEVKRLADEMKKQKEYERWIEKLKDSIYWEVRI